ncbi:MAG: DUF5522 domain-containing protein [Ilumatobacter sp.]
MGERDDKSAPLRGSWATVPDPRRLAPAHPGYDEILQRHDAAVGRGLPTYADPVSGFSVFTAAFLAKRGYCCESGCRHCPFVT